MASWGTWPASSAPRSCKGSSAILSLCRNETLVWWLVITCSETAQIASNAAWKLIAICARWTHCSSVRCESCMFFPAYASFCRPGRMPPWSCKQKQSPSWALQRRLPRSGGVCTACHSDVRLTMWTQQIPARQGHFQQALTLMTFLRSSTRMVGLT